jgi:PadR family transcriptional regulator
VLPLEVSILTAGVRLASDGITEFHGFLLAKHLRDIDGARTLTAHGTLYKALGRMEKAGLLTSEWESPDLAADDGRPRRRLYTITGAGRAALADISTPTETADRFDPGWSPS